MQKINEGDHLAHTELTISVLLDPIARSSLESEGVGAFVMRLPAFAAYSAKPITIHLFTFLVGCWVLGYGTIIPYQFVIVK